ncbi:hypothetical protein C8Q80DRAFT_1343604 [Daedaleopsis nitida]|nr:hypothetical protein C8Q80DRAFT_1343604 [Daedaleopsis nitida]
MAVRDSKRKRMDESSTPRSMIARLLCELLVEIFLLYDAAMEQSRLCCYRQLCPCCWLDLMLVCRRWRKIGVSTPLLWRCTELSRESAWCKLALARSGALPIQLLWKNAPPTQEHVELVHPHLQRVQKLLLTEVPASPVGKSPIASMLNRANMPLLDDLRLTMGDSEGVSSQMWTKVEVDLSRCPLLRFVALSSVSIRWTPAMFPKLRRLQLKRCVFHGSSNVTYDAFLAALATCVSLERLELTSTVGSLSSRTPATQVRSDGRVIDLPALRTLVLRDAPAVTSRFLSHIRFSPIAALDVVGTISTPPAQLVSQDLLISLLPLDPSHIHPLRRVTCATLECSEDKLEIWGYTDPPGPDAGDAEISLAVTNALGDDDWARCAAGSLANFRMLFAHAPLTDLRLSGEYARALDVRAWVGLLAAFPTVGILEVDGCGSPVAVLVALARSSSPQLEIGATVEGGRSAGGHSTDPEPVLPALYSLALMFLDWQTGVAEVLLTVLRRRLAQGLPKLDELYLEFEASRRPDEEDYENTMNLYGEDIRGLVASFEYRHANLSQ